MLKNVIVSDRKLLITCIKTIAEILTEAKNLYKSCLSSSKFVGNFDKEIKDNEDKLAAISHSFYPLLVASVSTQENQVIPILDKIKNLMYGKDMMISRVSERRCLIAPKNRDIHECPE